MYKVMFTGLVDNRFSWLGNDAEGGVNLLAKLLTEIQSATTSIDISSMTFSYAPGGPGPGATPGEIAAHKSAEDIAVALADKAAAGVAVRIMGNAGHRFQPDPVRVLHQLDRVLCDRVRHQQLRTEGMSTRMFEVMTEVPTAFARAMNIV